ncbi:MAGUK p55 subfamily member 5-A-like [Sinocyclocheilus grahami]|uniref:MAGUK p55 subfamily member 5-A-like n=1 Tax=Sinocyclocheilus grahami TaxID=75366 RepID=UPI0007AD3DC6|nr:PREDICTED: MAGUK p55 subfamily member 5-A-like [Sinocyclocheilus grahami]
MMMTEEEEEEEEKACEQATDLNSSSCLTSAQSSNEAITLAFFDGMDVAEEAKSTSEEKNTTELDDLLDSLQHLQLRLTDAESQQDVGLLLELLLQSDFQQAFIMHRSVAQSMRRLCPPFPLTAHAQQLRDENVLQSSKYNEATELTGLLTSPHLQALMEAHDCITEQELDVETTESVGQDEKTTKLVSLEKTRDMPLGVTVRNEHDRVVISRVVSGGTAEKSNLLSEGDEILEINGIPSFQQHREAMKKTITDRNQEYKGKLWRAKKSQKQRKKLLFNPSKNIEHYSEDILTYEEVALYHQPPNCKRPITLIGPPNSGHNELRQRLLSLEPDRFTGAVPHTTRNPRAHEVNGREYNFVSRQSFDCDLAAGKFIESGEFEQNLYGTNTDSVRQVVNSGKICLLCLHPRSLRLLCSSDLKPYIIFIRPPPPPPPQERFSTLLTRGVKKHMPEDVRETLEKVREMEHSYSHLFDAVITNIEQDKSVSELLRLIGKLDIEPQWVPSAWDS